MPAVTLNGPEKVLLPESVSVPVPALVTASPEITPEKDIGKPATSRRFMPGCRTASRTPASTSRNVSFLVVRGTCPGGASRTITASASVSTATHAAKSQ